MYRSIFKIDLARSLSEAIKRQILLNKDFDLAYFLNAADPEIMANGAYFNVDLAAYNASGAAYSPNNIYDVMKAVIPHISTAISVVYKNFQMYPEFLVAGIKTASLLRSMQQFMVSINFTCRNKI